MSANSHRENGLEGMRCLDSGPHPGQAHEHMRVALEQREIEVAKSANFPSRCSSNFSVGKHMAVFAQETFRLKPAISNADYQMPLAEQRGCGALRDSPADPDQKRAYRRAAWVRWCKFNLVGGMGVIVQFAALFVFKSALHFEYLLATGVAVEVAILHNFLWHERFTWVDRVALRPAWRSRFSRLVRFHLANGAVSLLGNLALMKVMVGQGHMNYLVANAVAILVCSLANFLVSEEWVFAD